MDRDEIIDKLTAGEIDPDAAKKALADLEQQKRGALHCKVSQKGVISVYGLQRMPVTLYVEQWERLLDFADEIRTFAKAHDAELTRKSK